MNKQGKGNLKENFAAIGWVLKKFFGFYPVLAPLSVFCILFSAIVAAIPAVFIQRVLAVIEKWYQSGDWASAKAELLPLILLLVGLYSLSIISLQSRARRRRCPASGSPRPAPAPARALPRPRTRP